MRRFALTLAAAIALALTLTVAPVTAKPALASTCGDSSWTQIGYSDGGTDPVVTISGFPSGSFDFDVTLFSSFDSVCSRMAIWEQGFGGHRWNVNLELRMTLACTDGYRTGATYFPVTYSASVTSPIHALGRFASCTVENQWNGVYSYAWSSIFTPSPVTQYEWVTY